MIHWPDLGARRYLAIGTIAVLLIGSGMTAHFSRRDAGITETKIPPETIEYLKGLADALGDLSFEFKPGTKSEWSNGEDDKQAADRGLERFESECFIVYYHAQDRVKADFTLQKAADAIPLMLGTFGRYPFPIDTGGRKLPLYICRDAEEYHRLSGEDVSRSRACAKLVLYADGGTLCQGLYFGPGTYDDGRESAAQVVAHELAHHVYFDRLSGNHRSSVPTWFTEGIAEYASGGEGFLPAVEGALKNGRLISLTKLSAGDDRFLIHPLVYGEGQCAFLAVEARYGKADVRELVDASYRSDMDGSLKRAIQKGLPEFEQEWLSYLHHRF